jgi:hypothetical protein
MDALAQQLQPTVGGGGGAGGERGGDGVSRGAALLTPADVRRLLGPLLADPAVRKVREAALREAALREAALREVALSRTFMRVNRANRVDHGRGAFRALGLIDVGDLIAPPPRPPLSLQN